MAITQKVIFFGGLFAAAWISGCGGYAHINGQKTAEIVQEELVRFHYCTSSVDCSQKRLVIYDEGINSLDVSVYADVTTGEASAIVASVLRSAEPGKINMQFFGAEKSVNLKVCIDKKAGK